ncbi:MAG: hypothetical protein ACLFQX_08325 [Candidatus Kapaibacterium sp.]
MRYFLIFLIIFIPISVFADDIDPDDLEIGKKHEYIIRLKNGDILTGYVTGTAPGEEGGPAIRFRTELGTALIYISQIEEIRPKEVAYRHSHRVFLLPTAEPIGGDHFIGMFEMLFLYGGAGIGDIVSITAGRSIVPGIDSRQQLTELNVKATVYNTDFESMEGGMSFAVGGNMAWANHNNRLVHYYGVATFRGFKSLITSAIFYKAGSEDYYRLNFGQNAVDMTYADGSFGIGLGLDTRFTRWHGLHFIGELWNSDITRPTNTGVLLGFRLSNSSFSADFGLSFFTQPLVAPFASFVWTPF